MSKIISIIPARSGLKEIKNKNIQLIGKKSLLQRSVDISNSIDEINFTLISTDSIEYLKSISKKNKFYFNGLRPKYLSNSKASTIETVIYEINKFEKLNSINIDFIIILPPTSPFRSIKDIKKGINLMKKNHLSSVVSVFKLKRKPTSILEIDGKGDLHQVINKKRYTFANRQEMNNLFHLNSNFTILRKEEFFKKKKIIIDPCQGIVQDEIYSINIDSKLDLEYSRFIFKKLL